MSLVIAPFDDTFHLDDMPVDVSDTAPIVSTEIENDRLPDVRAVTETAVESGITLDISRGRAYATVAILLTVNLLNYMDRYTVAGNLN